MEVVVVDVVDGTMITVVVGGGLRVCLRVRVRGGKRVCYKGGERGVRWVSVGGKCHGNCRS